jgi:hypothetical protein
MTLPVTTATIPFITCLGLSNDTLTLAAAAGLSEVVPIISPVAGSAAASYNVTVAAVVALILAPQ